MSGERERRVFGDGPPLGIDLVLQKLLKHVSRPPLLSVGLARRHLQSPSLGTCDIRSVEKPVYAAAHLLAPLPKRAEDCEMCQGDQLNEILQVCVSCVRVCSCACVRIVCSCNRPRRHLVAAPQPRLNRDKSDENNARKVQGIGSLLPDHSRLSMSSPRWGS